MTACSILPQAKPDAIREARADVAEMFEYLPSDAAKAPSGTFVEFVHAGGFHIPGDWTSMTEEELHALRWNGYPTIVDASEAGGLGMVQVVQTAGAYTGGGLMGNNYEVAVCWQLTVDLTAHSIRSVDDVTCPAKISWMFSGIDETLSIKDLLP